MKRKAAALTLAALMAVSLAGCGDNDPAYLYSLKASDYVEVADYSAIPVEAELEQVSDDYVDMYISYLLSQQTETTEVTDRDDVEEGDIVNIDYVGTKDGVAFDGGSATGYDLTIGSGSFIDGFEDGLIGHKVGETVELNLTFPEDYSNTDLAGQDVVFTVTINSISQNTTPELTDDYVAGQNITGVTTVDEYKAYIKKQLQQQAQSSYDSDVQNQIVDYLQENSTFKKDPPTEMVDRFASSYTDTLTSYATQYGLDLETFMNYFYGPFKEEPDEASTEDTTEAAEEASTEAVTEAAEASTEAEEASTEAATEEAEADDNGATQTYTEYIRDMADNAAREYIIMQAIADKENLNISNREYNNRASTAAAQMGYSSVSEFEKSEDSEAYREYLMVEKVLEWLEDKAVVTAPSDSASTESAEEASTEAAAESAEEASVEASSEAVTEADTAQ